MLFYICIGIPTADHISSVGERHSVMMEIRKILDDLPKLIKVILAIFVGFLYGGIYRLAPLTTKAIVIAVLWIITGGFFGIGWIVDLVCVILHDKPTVLVD